LEINASRAGRELRRGDAGVEEIVAKHPQGYGFEWSGCRSRNAGRAQTPLLYTLSLITCS